MKPAAGSALAWSLLVVDLVLPRPDRRVVHERGGRLPARLVHLAHYARVFGDPRSQGANTVVVAVAAATLGMLLSGLTATSWCARDPLRQPLDMIPAAGRSQHRLGLGLLWAYVFL
jgi:hypothetical protein